MIQVPIHKAKMHLAALVERAQAGEDIVLTRGGHSMVRLAPVNQPKSRRQFGAYKGIFEVDDDALLAPLPENELKAWNDG